MLVFGMHVHVGIEDPDVMIDVMNQSRYFLPHMLALSTSWSADPERSAKVGERLLSLARSAGSGQAINSYR